MKSFDEWWKIESLNTFDYPKEAAESGFEAGQQSKQAEVDELRKRIDDALKFSSDAHSDLNIGMLKMAEILKGDQS